ncbi:putative protein YqeY [Burkholderiales bacterium]|nr:MAG: GatB/YqeY domain-containing protein [Burkholderiales bacterium]CAG1008458.1 putative protein YqeY [Burkholderiales bacterium]
MSLKERITEDMKAAMRARDSARLGAIRLLLAALKQREVDERIILTDSDIVAVIDKMIKQRRDSITQFEAGKREDLAAGERFEIEVLSAYMPKALSAEEIAAAIDRAIAQTGAQGMAGMGKVMALLKPHLAGRADLTQVSGLVKARLVG